MMDDSELDPPPAGQPAEVLYSGGYHGRLLREWLREEPHMPCRRCSRGLPTVCSVRTINIDLAITVLLLYGCRRSPT